MNKIKQSFLIKGIQPRKVQTTDEDLYLINMPLWFSSCRKTTREREKTVSTPDKDLGQEFCPRQVIKL